MCSNHWVMNCKQETYRRLGDFITQRREKNNEHDVPIRGVSKEGFIDPKQKDADTSIYNVFYKNDFVFNPARMELNSIALNRDLEKGICSSLYEIFYINDTNELDPIYLNMLLKRDHFIRFCAFKGWGSVREYFRVNEICEYMIPVPPIEEQRKIVDNYLAIQKRIENNKQTIAKLEEAAQAIYRKMFVDDIDPENLPEGWRMGGVKDFGIVVTGKTPSSKCPEDFGLDVPFITPGDFNGSKFLIESTRYLSKIGADKLLTKTVKNGDLMVTCIGSDMGKVAIATRECISNQQINSIRVIKTEYTEYLYYVLANMKRRLLELGSGSSTLPMLNKNDFENIAILIPNDDVLKKFSIDMSSISKHILNISKSTILLNKIMS